MKTILKFTSTRGETVIFNNSGSFFYANKITGLGDVSADIQTQKAPYQDGATFLDSLLTPRPVSFEVFIEGVDSADISKNRAELARIFNPKLGEGLLEINYGGIVRVINAVAEHVPIYPSGKDNRGVVYQIGLIDLICPNPYWADITKTVEEFITIEGGLSFPVSLPSTFAQITVSKQKIVVNDGDVATPIKFTLQGPLTSPIRLSNETTGEFIEVKQSLLVDEKLVVDTAFGKKRVERITAAGDVINAFNYINLETTFWQLEPGNNLVSYSTGLEGELSPLFIEYKNKYVGI